MSNDLRAPRKVRTPARRFWAVVTSAITILFVIGVGIMAWPAALGGKGTWITVAGTSMEPNYSTSDLVLAWDTGDWQIGDVVLYGVQDSNGLIVHRLVSGSAEDDWYAQGDNKERIDPWAIPDDAIRGEEMVHIPHLGTALTWARSPQILAILTGILVFWAIFSGPKYIQRRLTRVPVRTPAVVNGYPASTVDLHTEGARFELPDAAIVDGDIPVEVWTNRDGTGTIARGILSVRHNVVTDHGRLVGGPVEWLDDGTGCIGEIIEGQS